MRRIQSRSTLLIAVVFALAACATQEAPPAAAPAVDKAAEEAAIRALSMKWLEFEKARDAAGVATLFAADGTMYRDHNEPITGAAAIQAYATKDYAENPKAVVEWSTDGVDVADSGEMAVERGSFSITGAGPDGKGSERGKYLTQWRKVNGEWKVVGDISITTVPAATTTTPQ
jgi:uncharacterized protein (TIGR02246 family)